MAKSVDQIIQEAGGHDVVAAALGVSRSALRKWRQFGEVPPMRQLSLIRMSQGRLSIEDFTPPSSPREPAVSAAPSESAA